MPVIANSPELLYVIVLFGLFVMARALQRIRIPAAVTSVILGVIAGAGFGWFQSDATIRLLSLFGIVALFLFAGLEVDFHELRKEKKIVSQHVGLFVLTLVVVTPFIQWVFDLPLRPALVVALALLTPSAGFILDSLATMGLVGNEPFWVKTKAISTEIVSLLMLFVVMQSTTWLNFLLSLGILLSMIALLPAIFRLFASKIVPFAPKSEFTFLIMMGLTCAFITRKLGVYYLVGAFVVGIAARRWFKMLPSLSSENMLHAVEVFAAFFIPFYFFSAGLEIHRKNLELPALTLGVLFVLVFIPARIIWVALHRWLALHEPFQSGIRVGMSIVPTLVFTLVLSDILRTHYHVSPMIFGALTLYALLNTLVPSFVFRLPAPDYVTPEFPDDAPPEEVR